MAKRDLKKELKQLYAPSETNVSIVEVPKFQYLMIDGQGAPDGQQAQQAIQTLFPLAYTIKFLMKKKGQDYAVMPLEGLWWADDMDDFINGNKNRWNWTYMIMQPEFVTGNIVEEAAGALKKKKDVPSLAKIRFESMAEGRCAQLLHRGSFSTEGPNIKRIHDQIATLGGTFDGHTEKHHEIYLSDFRKVAPNKMKTVLRQPFHI